MYPKYLMLCQGDQLVVQIADIYHQTEAQGGREMNASNVMNLVILLVIVQISQQLLTFQGHHHQNQKINI